MLAVRSRSGDIGEGVPRSYTHGPVGKGAQPDSTTPLWRRFGSGRRRLTFAGQLETAGCQTVK